MTVGVLQIKTLLQIEALEILATQIIFYVKHLVTVLSLLAFKLTRILQLKVLLNFASPQDFDQKSNFPLINY